MNAQKVHECPMSKILSWRDLSCCKAAHATPVESNANCACMQSKRKGSVLLHRRPCLIALDSMCGIMKQDWALRRATQALDSKKKSYTNTRFGENKATQASDPIEKYTNERFRENNTHAIPQRKATWAPGYAKKSNTRMRVQEGKQAWRSHKVLTG